MGQLRHVLVHTATPVEYVEDAAAVEWIEGEPGASGGPEPVRGAPFPVVLFLPLGTEQEDRPRSRKVTAPTVLWEPVNADTGAEAPVLDADAELLILAPELKGYFEQVDGEPEGTGRWQIDGNPQPFGPPGRVIGVQARLKAVTG